MDNESEIVPDFDPDAPVLRYMRQLAIDHGGDQQLWECISAFEFATMMFFRSRPSISVAEWVAVGRAMMARACFLKGEPLPPDPPEEYVIRQREEYLAMYRPMESEAVH